jgi:hypothetical protein
MPELKRTSAEPLKIFGAVHLLNHWQISAHAFFAAVV